MTELKVPPRPHVLVGKTIVAVALCLAKETLRFTVLDESRSFSFIYGMCYGDCCSSTWVETVESSARGLPAKVLAARELEMSRDPEDQEGSYIQFYGFLIETDQGAITLDYRNSSNGYYGGGMNWQVGEGNQSFLLKQTYTQVEV